MVRRLPEGLATPLGEAGGLVSGGEGQRVRFGRGLLRERPRLVILDEPFRGLSRDQRQALLRARTTSLVVGHAALRDPRHRRDRERFRGSW